MRGLLFLNGQPPKTLKSIDLSGITVCADGAYNYLVDYCTPDILVGDFDSLDQKNIRAKKIVQLNREKDYTDGHVAMQCLIDSGVSEVDIYGGFGLRRDHELSNYSLLLLAAKNHVRAVLRGDDFDVYFAEKSFRAVTEKGKTISLVPFSDNVHILFTQGLRYALNNEVLNKLHIKGISNIATQSIVGYEIQSGSALVFIEK